MKRSWTGAIQIVGTIAIAIVSTACNKPWNTANTALEAAAEAAASTDALVAREMVEDHEAARARVVREAQEALSSWEACQVDCGPRPTVEEFMERYTASVARWKAVTLALEELREALIVAQAAVGVWRDTKEQPGNWSTVCEALDIARGATVRAVEAAGVEVPDQYERMLEYLAPVCEAVVDRVGGGE